MSALRLIKRAALWAITYRIVSRIVDAIDKRIFGPEKP
jgi:hypothetical protein